jgi:hypothetical protein
MLGCGVNGVATLDCIFPLIANLIYWLIFFSGTVALIMIIISGIRFITSGGDAKALSTANKTWFYAIVGLLLVFLAFLILNTIASITGVACIKDFATGVSLTNPFQACGAP